LIFFVVPDDFHASLFAVERVQDFVEPRITLFFVHENNQLRQSDVFRFALGAENSSSSLNTPGN
jgi:hypothetical protein